MGRSNDWFEVNSMALALILEEKCCALINYKFTPNDQTLQALRYSRKKRRHVSPLWQGVTRSNNYCGICLLSITGKLFARVTRNRLQVLAEKLYPESQPGVQVGRSTLDMIFSLRQLQEKCREQQKTLYIAFINLTEAFDLVNRSGLFQHVKGIGCPPKHMFCSMICSYAPCMAPSSLMGRPQDIWQIIQCLLTKNSSGSILTGAAAQPSPKHASSST